MFKCAVFTLIALILCCTACAPLFGSSKKGIMLEQQSLVRWNAEENTLEVYAAIANQADADASFKAAIVFLNPPLRDAVGLDRVEVTEDDRNGKTPFLLKPYTETVLKHTFATAGQLERAWLSKGVGIEITTKGKRMTLPIKYGEIG